MLPKLYLASASPRRRELLAQLNLPFSLVLPDVEERQFASETAANYVQRLARDKATAGVAKLIVGDDSVVDDTLAILGGETLGGDTIAVLGGDTIVVLDGEVLEKPHCQIDGMQMLRRLSGRSHQVLTAMALLIQGGPSQGVLHEVCVSSEVTFRVLSERDIERYWHSGEPTDKAGGYGIQGLGGCFVARINGSYSGVVGLPLVETHALLQAAGLLADEY